MRSHYSTRARTTACGGPLARLTPTQAAPGGPQPSLSRDPARSSSVVCLGCCRCGDREAAEEGCEEGGVAGAEAGEAEFGVDGGQRVGHRRTNLIAADAGAAAQPTGAIGSGTASDLLARRPVVASASIGGGRKTSRGSDGVEARRVPPAGCGVAPALSARTHCRAWRMERVVPGPGREEGPDAAEARLRSDRASPDDVSD
jgi:hypothetical protein